MGHRVDHRWILSSANGSIAVVKLNQNLGIYYSDNENHNQTRLVHTYVYGYILVVHMVQNPLEFRANGERD